MQASIRVHSEMKEQERDKEGAQWAYWLGNLTRGLRGGAVHCKIRLATSRLETGMSLTFFYGLAKYDEEA
jgi:hypothetical protein